MNGLGKLYDHYQIKPGGRVDQFWKNKIKIDLKNFRGRDKATQQEFYDPMRALEVFQLYSIEFGNWMNQNDRANFLYGSVQSLKDIAKCLNIPQQAIGFNGTLSLALGARGKGGSASAFFIPTHELINLTKTKGEGTIGHEYGHAIDMKLGERIKNYMASGGQSMVKKTNLDHPKGSIQYLFEKVFDILYWNAGKPTPFQEYIKGKPEYWQYRAEVWARTFEVYLHLCLKNRQLYNTFLIDPSQYRHPVYPSENLVRKASPIISQLIKKAYEKR